ncbi:MAG TPA: DUF1223 domain-containing protein [Stellaceae bacterium]|jgi:hypothetical protein|nr:DUF1223 domain-containing protein [Stellaceae bacterium]
MKVISVILALLLSSVAAAAETRPVVVELFTSQGCSSCPPADKLLGELAQRGNVIALGYHITYWDGAQWHDPLSLREATERQQAYDETLTRGQIYTPQMVIEGTEDVVGSERSLVLAALDKAKPVAAASVTFAPDRRSVTIGAGAAPAGAGVLLARYVLRRATEVKGGENAGHAAVDVNAVTSLKMIGEWAGKAESLPIEPPRDGEGLALLVQSPDGRFLGAASIEGPATSPPQAPRA